MGGDGFSGGQLYLLPCFFVSICFPLLFFFNGDQGETQPCCLSASLGDGSFLCCGAGCEMTLHVLYGWGGGYARCRMTGWSSDDEGDHEMRDGGRIADGLSYLLKSGGCHYQVFC